MNVIEWLLDSDPAIRWQVMCDLTDASSDVVARERARVASEGWGSRLLGLQAPGGDWGGGPWLRASWRSTLETLMLLRDLGLDRASERCRHAIALVRDRSTWGPEFGNAAFFEGETEACINGRVLATGAYFGVASDLLVDRLIGEQMVDGGWNCYAPPSTRSSFHSTICVLEGLLEYENAKGATSIVTDARLRGQDYLLERKMFRALSSGNVIDSAWTQFSFPTRWHYDVLRGVDYLRKAGVERDPRLAEAIGLIRAKRDADGRWPLENVHAGDVHFDFEDGICNPSRWVTLRASRVLRWYDRSL